LNNLTQRIITGSLFVAALVFFILWNSYSIGIVFFVCLLIGSLELTKLLNNGEPNKIASLSKIVVLGNAYVLSFLILRESIEIKWIFILIPLITLFFVYELFTTKRNSFRNLNEILFGLLYVFIPFMSLNILGTSEKFATKVEVTNSQHILLGFFVILWTSDSMAYVTGKLIGKNKIAPAISPGKTWEGVIGGFAFSLVAAFLISYFTESSLYLWLGMAAIISSFGFIGDLSESMLKRKAGLKDSGNLLPGHGGILDRFDGIVFSAPLVMCYLFWI